MERILVVDDEASMRLALTEVLRRSGFEVTAVESGVAALSELAERAYGMVISDMRMPGMGGADLLAAVQAQRPGLPMVMITAYGTVEDAVAAMKAGAREFLTKPFSPRDLLHLVEGILREPSGACAAPGDEAASGEAVAGGGGPAAASTAAEAACATVDRRIVSRSAAMQQILEVAQAVSGSRAPVLVQGESGTGKELLARFVHFSGSRRAHPFVAVNCAALPRELLESELFGHERGAFTGAIARKLGKFELADKGTILLDEVSEMEPALQAKLLRVLQEREVDRLGGSRPVAIDARVIATTNRDLKAAVASGSFRRDLYYRLHVVPLVLPPLRERSEDIDALLDHFAARFAAGRPVAFTAEARAALRRHPWPGNVRELEHVVERAILLSHSGTIGAEALLLDEEAQAEVPSAQADASSLAGRTVHEVERQLIFATLKRTNNNRSHAARMLGISVRTLRNKLSEYRTSGVVEAHAS